MPKYIVAIIVLIVALVTILSIASNSQKTNQSIKEPHCSELIWMRDLPQARCVEYWKQRNIEESKEDK